MAERLSEAVRCAYGIRYETIRQQIADAWGWKDVSEVASFQRKRWEAKQALLFANAMRNKKYPLSVERDS